MMNQRRQGKDETCTEIYRRDEMEDSEMDDDLRSLTRKRTLQEENGESKRQRIRENEMSPIPTSSTLTDSQDTPVDVLETSQVLSPEELPAPNNRYQSAKAHIQRCKDLLQKLKTKLTQSASLREDPKVKLWKNDLEELETKLALPETVIAVVGNTGAGKSSLMNALLDQQNILPTSGQRACTAVVAEVVSNTDNDKYEADITFLSKEDWDEELRFLLSDLTDVNGKLKKGNPDSESLAADVAYNRIMAVYGKIDCFEVLKQQTDVTSWLGRVKPISHSEPVDFRDEIEEYITDDSESGKQFWPIVKKVTIRLPNSDACSSGAVLVDLPGVGDSNAARNKIAEDYLKNCTAVWVISPIQRAIDDKTAKDLLGENFRRQLLMDGQYGSISVICTKTDAIKISEIIRELHLKEKSQPLEKKIKDLENEKKEINRKHDIRRIKQMEKRNEELRREITNQEGEGESQELEENKKVLEEKQNELRENEKQIEDYRVAKITCLQLDETISETRKELSSLCAKARNDRSKEKIGRDFKDGLREMKKKARMCVVEEEMDDVYDGDDDDIMKNTENLQVFCVSAMEYQKMRESGLDGPPTVFSKKEETQIPALRSYIHQMTAVRHQKSLEKILQRAAQLVFNIENHLTETNGEQIKVQSDIKEVLMEKFKSKIEELRFNVESEINKIKPKLEEGITAAKAGANEKAAKLSSSVNKGKEMHYSTYRAIVQRNGEYRSRMKGGVNINFNQDLTKPIYTSISIVWNKVFNEDLLKYFEKFKGEVLIALNKFVLNQELPHAEGIQPNTSTQAYILDNANHQLSVMVEKLKKDVKDKQMDANRDLTPKVKEKMIPTYEKCKAEKGPKSYERMKECLKTGIEKERSNMFDEASRELLHSLEGIKIHVLTIVQEKCNSLCSDVQKAFEALMEDPGTSVQLRDQLLTCVGEISQKMRTILEKANVEVPSSFSASSTDQPSSSTSR